MVKWRLKNPTPDFLIFSGDSRSWGFKGNGEWNTYRSIYTLWADPGLKSAGQNPGVNTKGFSLKPDPYCPWLFFLASIWDGVSWAYRAVRSGYGHIPISLAFAHLPPKPKAFLGVWKKKILKIPYFLPKLEHDNIALWLQRASSTTQMPSKGSEAESALRKLSRRGFIPWAIPWTDRCPFVTGGSWRSIKRGQEKNIQLWHLLVACSRRQELLPLFGGF